MGFDGCFVLHPNEVYLDETDRLLDDWASSISYWEETVAKEATDYELAVASEKVYLALDSIIDSWYSLEPPDEFEEYHEWMNIAINYDRQAFGLVNEYYSSTSNDQGYLEGIRNNAQQLWILKDQALFEANDAYRQAIPD